MSRLRSFLPIVAFLVGCHADRPAETTTTSGTAAHPFPQDDAKTALVAAAKSAHVCRQAGEPAAFDVNVRFEPSGRVSQVTVAPMDGAEAACVKGKMTDVAVMPFEGAAVTLPVRVTM